MTMAELLELVAPRLTGPVQCSFFAAMREAVAIVSHRLLLRRSDMLKVDLSLEMDAETSQATLPVGFLALAELPFVAGETRSLTKLSSREVAQLTTPGLPSCFAISGSVIKVGPAPDVPTTVTVPAFVRPQAPTVLTDEVPFNGHFDAPLVEAVTLLAQGGLVMVADAAFVAVIQSQVDAVLDAIELADEQVLADSINEQ